MPPKRLSTSLTALNSWRVLRRQVTINSGSRWWVSHPSQISKTGGVTGLAVEAIDLKANMDPEAGASSHGVGTVMD